MNRVRHKQSNRFKFQSFAERISIINVDIFHRVPHRYEEGEEEGSTYFYQAVQKWATLNLTENFKLFRNEVGREISTLPQLLNNKEKIIEVFLNHIKLQNILSLQPVLEILVAFVKDIRSEFYSFYPQILKELISLLHIRDPEILESTFTCLAYIFKYLTKELVRDLDKVLRDLAPLLTHDRPDYVRDFAAQSFAFVARKVRDREKFLLLILQTVQSFPELLTGSSQLIFHMMCGIKGQSHSCVEELLYTIFSSFGKASIPQKLLFDMTNTIVTLYGNAIEPKHSVLLAVLHKALEEKMGIASEHSNKSIKHLLKIMKTSLQCRSGATLPEALVPSVTSTLIKLITVSDHKTRKLCTEICGDILVLGKVKIPQEVASLMVMKIMDTKEEKLLLDFVEQLVNFSGFETIVLPRALEIFCSVGGKHFLKNLAKIISDKVAPRMQDHDILNTPIYAINLNNSTIKIKKIITEILENFNPLKELTDDVLHALIIVRHVSPTDSANCDRILSIVENILKLIDLSSSDRDRLLFVCCTALESLFYLRNSSRIEEGKINVIFPLLIGLLQKENSILALRMVSLLLTVEEDPKLSKDLLKETCRCVQEFTMSPFSHARFLALQLLLRLHTLSNSSEDSTEENMSNILQICLNIEVVPLSINDYREKIKELQKLKFESLPPLTDDDHRVIIKYILGVLYCNFQLLWEPIMEILATFAEGTSKTFWNIFLNHLITVTDVCKKKINPYNVTLPTMDEFLLQSVRFVKVEDKGDFNNYRFLMWKSMTHFVSLCESKNRDVIPLYLNFLQEELLKSSSQHNLTISIKQNETTNTSLNEDELDETVVEDIVLKTSSPHVIKWAIAQLNLLSKFQSPKVCYREPELRNSYYDLLLHKNLEIQKLALECLFTYSFKFMTPYKQNLRNLIDDAKFKNEKLHFQSSKENGDIQECHREELMPIVMRILYNKMISRSAIKRGSKGSDALQKRSIVFRFLSGCTDSEIEIFLKMAFKSFEVNRDADSTCFAKIMNSVDLEHVIPPKKLQNVINLADAIVEHFGGLMRVNIQRYVLKILFTVGAIIGGIFSQRENVFSGFMTSVKNLRAVNADCLAKFFDRLSYPWSDDEINSVFEIFVWPNLEKLPVEGFYNPTAVLRLFSTWSENPRYFNLFRRYKSNDLTVTPLPFVMQLLLNEKTQSSVTSYIIRIIENLLTLEEETPDENVEEYSPQEPPLNVIDILPIDKSRIEKLSLKEELNDGSKILLPHIGSILTYLRRRLEKSNSTLQKTELNVLSRVTELATSPENADSLMTILLRLLTSKKMTDEEILMNTLTTVENLSKIVNKPMSYLKPLAVLLGSLESMESRRILLTALMNLQNRCPGLKDSVTILQNLNSYDPKRIYEPDFDKRIDTYKLIRTMASEGKIDINLAVMVLYDCFHVISNVSDLSLRDGASHCLREICPSLARSWKNDKPQNQFWIDSILKLIHKGVAATDENRQSFAISLLGVMARECGDLHPVLKDLSVYVDKADLEVDLFENAIHLQSHRRVRSMLRFCTLSKKLKSPPNSRSLIQFILPMATRYLCNEKYADKNSLIDAAISCLGAACRFLQWQKYQAILRYYLAKFHGKIEYQRQLVRIVIAILDSFHFDISKAFEARPSEKKETKSGGASNQSTAEHKVQTEEETENKDEEENEILDELNDDNNIDWDGEECEKEVKKGDKTEENNIYAYQVVTVLNSCEAARIERAINGSLLLKLTKAIGQRTQMEDTHKTNYKSLGPGRDEEEVARIPIAVTVVKLLQKISDKILGQHLPGIFMRLCTFLKSKMESVRRTTRETLQQIMTALGPKYLRVILEEMTAALTKGFQLHVLIYTLHSIIQSIQDQLQPGDIDDNIPVLIQICKTDIFGLPSEEKKVTKIQVKHKEVRSNKSFRLMSIISQHITNKCVTDVLLPIKEVLTTSTSHKSVSKCQECLRHVVLGLCANKFIETKDLFIYVYGVTSESIPQLTAGEQVQEKKKKTKVKPDCFIIPEEPKSRTGVLSNAVKKSSKSNTHVLLEFGFQLLQFLIKKEKLRATTDFKSYLDPMGPILVKAVESQHVKVATLALNCLCKLLKYDLPSIKNEAQILIRELFSILHKYAAPGLGKGDTFDFVLVAFKTICVILRDTNYKGIDAEKLKILLVCVEQDIYDNNRQATAFNLLKIILKKKLKSPELNQLMKKVAELSISSDLGHVRLQARQTVFQYVMDYPLGKELEYFIGFYISQLSFELESGRHSALEVIHSFITSFPESVLNEQCGVFLITLGARLINDDSPQCKKAVSGIVKSMLMRLSQKYRDQLFEMVKMWLKQKKTSHRRLAAQIAGFFVAMEKSDFAKRLPSLLPLLQLQFTGDSKPGRFVRLATDDSNEKPNDYHLFQVLQLLLKISSHCPEFLTDSTHQDSINLFTEMCQSLLCHAHEWVRLAASQFLGCVFNSIEPAKVALVLNGQSDKSDLSFLEASSLRRRLRSLILDHVSQFITGTEISLELIEQTTKNLVYFARVLKDVKSLDNEVIANGDDIDNDKDTEEPFQNMSLIWLIKKMRRIVNREVAETPLSYVLRTGVLRWIGAVTVCFSRKELIKVLYHLMAPVIRERDLVEGENANSPIKSLVLEVTDLLKNKVGVDEFTKEAVRARKAITERRAQRKTERMKEFVTNPERAAKRKIEKQAKKKILKKRKIESFKGKGIKRYKDKKKSEDLFF